MSILYFSPEKTYITYEKISTRCPCGRIPCFVQKRLHLPVYAGGITLSNNSIGKLTKKDADKACNGSDNATLGIECTAIEK